MLVRMLSALCIMGVASLQHREVTDDVMSRELLPGLGEYFYFGIPMNWTEGYRSCQASNAHIVIIDSPAEAAGILDMMARHGANFTHLGVHDQLVEGKYITLFGQPVGSPYTSGIEWAVGAPQGGSEFNCAGFSEEGFTDTRCGDQHVLICELRVPKITEPLPEGYSLIPGFGYYKFYPQSTEWPVADQTCRDESANLLILNSQEEIDAIAAHFFLIIPFWFHVGVHRFVGPNENYITVLGGPLNATGFSTWLDNGFEPWGDFIDWPFVQYYAKTTELRGLGTMLPPQKFTFICERGLE